jgi:UDP-N-acetylmuramoyl-tripeptide--D-alanyl-D-alanine ligase
MELSLDEVIAATGGRSPPAVEMAGVSVRGAATDSRAVRAGNLFVPVVGERDGHQFIPSALAAGAAAYLTSRPLSDGAGDAPGIEVTDTVSALADLGRLARSRLGERVVGVTGSVGKTSVKDLCAAVLSARWRTAAAPRSFNNELGVPLTLLDAPADTQATVVELGARRLGHVAELCRIARPTVGIVTAVGAAHLELFGSIEDVARGKGELVESLPARGWAVLNADDPRVAAMTGRTEARVVTYGKAGDVRAEGVVLDVDLHPSFRLVSPWGSVDVNLRVSGAHMVGNALAAAAAGLALGLEAEEVAAGLVGARLSPWRMELHRLPSGARVLNDAYNANPLSMRAALDALADLPGRGRRVAVLGAMAELGEDSHAAHREVAERAARLGVEVVAVGTHAYGTAPVADHAEAVARLGVLVEGDAVLVKASRIVGLEQLADQLAGRAG